MDLPAVFYMSVYGLAALAGGVLAWAEGQFSPTVFLPPLAVAALFLNERWKQLRLPPLIVNLCGIGAFVYPVVEVSFGSIEARLLAGAHLLVLLQATLLIHHKTAYQYWWMCAISCLQMALAAILTTSAAFGCWLLLYIFWAMWTLSVYTLLLSHLTYGENRPKSTGWDWPRLGETRDDRPRYSDRNACGEFRVGLQAAPDEAGITWRFARGVLTMTAAAVCFGMIVFILTPRVWLGGINALPDSVDIGGRPLTGFSEKVQLGDFGRILENPAPVLELRVFDNDTNRALPLAQVLSQMGMDEPLLRGSTLLTYENGEWFGSESPNRVVLLPLRSPRANLWRHELAREAIGTPILFSLLPPMSAQLEDATGRILFDKASGCLSVTSNQFARRLNYTLWTYQPTGEQERPGGLDENTRLACLRLPNHVERLKQLALQIKADALSKLPQGVSPEEFVARSLESYLRDSGEFGYSLQLNISDPRLDPVEDFLFNRKEGHCQYFATALALMLRACDIPSRVVSGFKGAAERYDPTLLVVQQRHAHAWVDVYLNDRGAWISMDATPPALRDSSVAEIGRRAGLFSDAYATASGLWQDYVVNLSFSRQQRDLYEPLKVLAFTFWEHLRDTRKWGSGTASLLSWMWRNPQEWLSWKGGLFVFFAGIFGTVLYYGGRAIRRTWRRLWGLSHYQRSRGRRVEWYERFLKLVQQWRIEPQAHQTPQEFAERIRRELPVVTWPVPLQDLPDRITAAFYRLRYGEEEDLLPGEEAELKDLLNALEQVARHEARPIRPAD